MKKTKPTKAFMEQFKEIFGVNLLDFYSYKHQIYKLNHSSFHNGGFDQWIIDNDPEYELLKGIYKGKLGCSTFNYIKLKYGEVAMKMIKYLIWSDFEYDFNPKNEYGWEEKIFKRQRN